MRTSLIAPSSTLRRALLADAAVSAGAGLMQAAGGAAVVSMLGLPQALLLGSGLFMLAYAAALVALARAETLHCLWIAIIVFGNFAWADACVALWAFDLVLPTSLGAAWLLLQAAVVTALAVWQGIGWRSSRAVPVGGAAWHSA